ncbi:MAG: flagellar hook-associated protein 3 [Desulfobacterales bacterium]|nr:flagellar hook-associated protein 3 [Desulfobacterales bacterium]
MSETVASYLFKQGQALSKKQEVVASGKRVNRPSDAPTDMGRILDYRKTVAALEQYKRNVSQVRVRIQTSETVLDGVSEWVTKAIAVARDNTPGTGDTESWQAAAEDVDNIREQVLSLANTKIGGIFIFGGRQTDTPPFVHNLGTDQITYAGDNTANADMRIAIGESVKITIKANGEEIFNGAQDVFLALKDLKDELNQPVPDPTVIKGIQGRLEQAALQIEKIRGLGSTTFKRLEVTESQLDQFIMNYEKLQSDTENADLAQAILEMQSQETAYQTSLGVAAQTIQKTLLDYL